jgi:uncharacterized protein YdaU (DUF1376 family)
MNDCDLQDNCVTRKPEPDIPKATLWMPWFIKDHRANASTLDHIEHSALCYLNMLLWEHGGIVRDDDKWISRNLRLSQSKWKAIKDVVLAGCDCSGGVIKSQVIIDEFAKAQANIEQKRKAGIASAMARKQSTAVERTLQRNANGEATARQPRAGSGEGGGSGPYQVESSVLSKRGVKNSPPESLEANNGNPF